MATETGHIPSRIYFARDGSIVDANGLQLGLQVTISPAAGSANVCLVTFQVVDGAGNAINQVFELSWYLSDASTGAGLTATSASGAVAVGSAGADILSKSSKKAGEGQTDATGKYILSITDTAKTLFYPCCTIPGSGVNKVGAQLVTGNYG